jgi:hypothetical protein
MHSTELLGHFVARCADGLVFRRCLVCMLLVLSLDAVGAEPDAVATREIAQLIDHLRSSGCQFNRNGSWYDAARAVDHLKRKYEYLLKRGLVPNAEAFIDRAASESSASGKPYIVKCANAPEVTSGAWFREALAKFRDEASGSDKRDVPN